MKQILRRSVDLKEVLLVTGSVLFWNCAVYFGARLITGSWYHYDMTLPFDEMVPLVKWTVILYFGCYLFWGANYLICALGSEAERNRFFSAEVLAKGICFGIFLLIPTTNVRPEILGDTLWDHLMRLLYWVDAPDNLFPSLHCLVSWFCWIGVRNRTEIPFWYRSFSLLAAITICVVTLTTKQHVIVDVFSSVLLAELCYFIAGHTGISSVYSAGLGKVKKIFSI